MPQRDDYVHGGCPVDSSAEFFSITPSDTVDLTAKPRAIYIGGSGDLAIRNLDGTTVTFKGNVAGNMLPCRTTRVMATGTTATFLIAIL